MSGWKVGNSCAKGRARDNRCGKKETVITPHFSQRSSRKAGKCQECGVRTILRKQEGAASSLHTVAMPCTISAIPGYGAEWYNEEKTGKMRPVWSQSIPSFSRRRESRIAGDGAAHLQTIAGMARFHQLRPITLRLGDGG
jgi:hypothetical protein